MRLREGNNNLWSTLSSDREGEETKNKNEGTSCYPFVFRVRIIFPTSYNYIIILILRSKDLLWV